MGCLSVRVLVWLLAVCIPFQAGMAVALRAQGPAHAHVDVPAWAVPGLEQGIDAVDAHHAAWHALEHEGLRAAHHDHDAADDSVVLMADASDDEPEAGGFAGKVSVIDLPGLLPCAPGCPVTALDQGLAAAATVAFVSVTAVPLYRPPR